MVLTTPDVSSPHNLCATHTGKLLRISCLGEIIYFHIWAKFLCAKFTQFKGILILNYCRRISHIASIFRSFETETKYRLYHNHYRVDQSVNDEILFFCRVVVWLDLRCIDRAALKASSTSLPKPILASIRNIPFSSFIILLARMPDVWKGVETVFHKWAKILPAPSSWLSTVTVNSTRNPLETKTALPSTTMGNQFDRT